MYSDEQTDRAIKPFRAVKRSVRRAVGGTAIAAVLPCALLLGASAAQARPVVHPSGAARHASPATHLSGAAQAYPTERYSGRSSYDLVSGTATWYNRSVLMSGQITDPRRASEVCVEGFVGSQNKLVSYACYRMSARTERSYKVMLSTSVRGGISHVGIASFSPGGSNGQWIDYLGRP